MPPRQKGRAHPKAQRFTKFLDFPTEIRLRIYEFTLCFDGVEPKVEWVDFAMDHRMHYDARERDSYVELEPKPRPWPIEVRLDCLARFRPFFATPSLEPPVDHGGSSTCADSARQQSLVPLASVLGVVSTCRQIYMESKGVFWSKNKFIIDNMWGLYYFSYGLGPHRRRYLTWVGISWTRFPSIDTNQDAAIQTEFLLDFRFQGLSPMSSISHRPSSEYDFVYKILDAMESRSENFNEKLDRYGQRSAKVEARRNKEDGTAMAVFDADGHMKDSIDVLSEAIQSYQEQQLERLQRNRRGWHIEFEWFWYREKLRRLSWLTNAATLPTCFS